MATNNPKIKVKDFYSEDETVMSTVQKETTISREDCKVIVYVTICPQDGGNTFKTNSNIGELIKVKDIQKYNYCLSRLRCGIWYWIQIKSRRRK